MTQKIQLPYTLQTQVGMVLNSGMPAHRNYRPSSGCTYPEVTLPSTIHLPGSTVRPASSKRTSINPFQDFLEKDWHSPANRSIIETAIRCIRERTIPARSSFHGEYTVVHRYLQNINACRNQDVDIYHLIKLIKSRTRLDLEQAAGAIISAFVNAGRLDDAELLLRELAGVLSASDMSVWHWHKLSQRYSQARQAMEALAKCSEKVYSSCEKMNACGSASPGPNRPQNYTELVRLLLRIRRVRPKQRCLYIPAWLFKAAGIDPPGDHGPYLNGYQAKLAACGDAYEGILGYQYPQMEPGDDSIVLSKHLFRRVQNRIYKLYPFWDLEIRLRRDVRGLEDSVLYAADWVNEELRETDDVAKVAFWFFAYQRRMQQRVVSNYQCTRFLAKGEGATIYQNNLDMRSTFEEVLARIAGFEGSDGLGTGSDDTLELIDKTCLLMKTYVDVHGAGKKKNLVYSRDRGGGSGRGPVDEYNMLCDILGDLEIRAKSSGIEHVPGPVYKFLAKDIMSWNDTWADDAFANDRVHGWEGWLKDRGLDKSADVEARIVRF